MHHLPSFHRHATKGIALDTPSLYEQDGALVGYVPTAVIRHHGMASRLRTLLKHAKALPEHAVEKADSDAFLAKMAALDDDQWRIVQVSLAREGLVALLGATMAARPHPHHAALVRALASSVDAGQAPERLVLAAWDLARAWGMEKAYWYGQDGMAGVPIALWRWMADTAEHEPRWFLEHFGAPYVSMDTFCGAPRGGTPVERAALTLRLVSVLLRCAAPVDRMQDTPVPYWVERFAAHAQGTPAADPLSFPPTPHDPAAARIQAIGAALGGPHGHHLWHNSLHVVLSLLAGWPPTPTLELAHQRGLLPVGLPGSVLDDPTGHKILALTSRLSKLDPGSVRLAAQETLAALDSFPKLWVDMRVCGHIVQINRALRSLFLP